MLIVILFLFSLDDFFDLFSVLVQLKKIIMDNIITHFSIFEAPQMDQLLHCIVEQSH